MGIHFYTEFSKSGSVEIGPLFAGIAHVDDFAATYKTRSEFVDNCFYQFVVLSRCESDFCPICYGDGDQMHLALSSIA